MQNQIKNIDVNVKQNQVRYHIIIQKLATYPHIVNITGGFCISMYLYIILYCNIKEGFKVKKEVFCIRKRFYLEFQANIARDKRVIEHQSFCHLKYTKQVEWEQKREENSDKRDPHLVHNPYMQIDQGFRKYGQKMKIVIKSQDCFFIIYLIGGLFEKTLYKACFTQY